RNCHRRHEHGGSDGPYPSHGTTVRRLGPLQTAPCRRPVTRLAGVCPVLHVVWTVLVLALDRGGRDRSVRAMAVLAASGRPSRDLPGLCWSGRSTAMWFG